MGLLLDTCVVIDIMRGWRPDFRSALGRAGERGETIHVSVLTVMELNVGLFKSTQPERRRKEIASFLSRISAVDFTSEDAIAAGLLSLKRRLDGMGPGVIDTLIAGQALARGWSVVTNNVRHFALPDGPPVIDWAQSDQPLDPAAIAASLRRTTKD